MTGEQKVCARPTCGRTFTVGKWKGHTLCSKRCVALATRTRLFDPTKEDLERDVAEMPASRIAEKYGVSGRAVGKRCALLGVPTRPRGFWAKEAAGKLIKERPRNSMVLCACRCGERLLKFGPDGKARRYKPSHYRKHLRRLSIGEAARMRDRVRRKREIPSLDDVYGFGEA